MKSPLQQSIDLLSSWTPNLVLTVNKLLIYYDSTNSRPCPPLLFLRPKDTEFSPRRRDIPRQICSSGRGRIVTLIIHPLHDASYPFSRFQVALQIPLPKRCCCSIYLFRIFRRPLIPDLNFFGFKCEETSDFFCLCPLAFPCFSLLGARLPLLDSHSLVSFPIRGPRPRNQVTSCPWAAAKLCSLELSPTVYKC